MSRVPFVLFLILPLCVWPTNFTKSVFHNKQTNNTTRIPQRPYVLPTQCDRHLFLGTSSLSHHPIVYCSAILRSRPCICYLTQFPNYSGISELPRVGALLLSHDGQEKLHRKDDDGQSPNKYRHTDVIRSTANTRQWYQYVQITTAFCLTSQILEAGSFFRS
jgi:hypothetical protein